MEERKKERKEGREEGRQDGYITNETKKDKNTLKQVES